MERGTSPVPERPWIELDASLERPAFGERAEREAAGADETIPLDRRSFLALAGLSASLAACSRLPVRHALPYLVAPEEITPGVSTHYASTCFACPAACGLVATVRDGRPVSDLDRLGAALGASPEAIREALAPLLAAGLVVETAGEPSGFLLARDPHELTVERALAAYERPCGRPAAFVWHVQHLYLGFLLEHLPSQMRDAEVARRAEDDLFRPRSGERRCPVLR